MPPKRAALVDAGRLRKVEEALAVLSTTLGTLGDEKVLSRSSRELLKGAASVADVLGDHVKEQEKHQAGAVGLAAINRVAAQITTPLPG